MKIVFDNKEVKGKDEDFRGWRIWQHPKELHMYAIGVDTAEGKGRDASVIQVIDVNTGTLVANFWSNEIDEDNLAAEAYKAGYYYNKGRVIIEINNTGHTVVTHLSGSMGGLRYPFLYKRIDYDEFTQKKTKVLGFRTTTVTKPRIISNLKSALRDGDLKILDTLTINELSTFLRDEKTGKLGAKGSARDDRVMALALAWEQATIMMLTRSDKKYENIEKNYDPITGMPSY